MDALKVSTRTILNITMPGCGLKRIIDDVKNHNISLIPVLKYLDRLDTYEQFRLLSCGNLISFFIFILEKGDLEIKDIFNKFTISEKEANNLYLSIIKRGLDAKPLFPLLTEKHPILVEQFKVIQEDIAINQLIRQDPGLLERYQQLLSSDLGDKLDIIQLITSGLNKMDKGSVDTSAFREIKNIIIGLKTAGVTWDRIKKLIAIEEDYPSSNNGIAKGYLNILTSYQEKKKTLPSETAKDNIYHMITSIKVPRDYIINFSKGYMALMDIKFSESNKKKLLSSIEPLGHSFSYLDTINFFIRENDASEYDKKLDEFLMNVNLFKQSFIQSARESKLDLSILQTPIYLFSTSSLTFSDICNFRESNKLKAYTDVAVHLKRHHDAWDKNFLSVLISCSTDQVAELVKTYKDSFDKSLKQSNVFDEAAILKKWQEDHPIQSQSKLSKDGSR